MQHPGEGGTLDLMTGGKLDFENILPAAMLRFAPVGILGLVLAGLLAAFMSTFASTVNAAPAYLVNDIYKRYINPEASNKRLVYASYAISVAVVAISTTIPSRGTPAAKAAPRSTVVAKYSCPSIMACPSESPMAVLAATSSMAAQPINIMKP